MRKKEISVFDHYRNLKTDREILRDSRKAVVWFNTQLKKLGSIPDRKVILTDTGKNRKLRNEPIYGKMFLFFYDAKTKTDLNYFDRFPIVIPIESVTTNIGSRGFLGLNLHYLEPTLRIRFLNLLFDIKNNKRNDVTTRFTLTYKLLKKTKKLKAFQPCLKIYLTDPRHIQSSMLELSYPDWITVSMLPTEFFVSYKSKASGAKVSNLNVWSDSRRKIK